MTLQDALKYGREQLLSIYPQGEAAGIAQLLIEYLDAEEPKGKAFWSKKELSFEKTQDFNSLIQRLLAHEPVQYVIGQAWFGEVWFGVSPAVLIPRPETEELVEWIIADSKFPLGKTRILDIGTGSGCIAISLKRRLGKPETWAIDLSQDAIDIALANAERLGQEIIFKKLNFLNPAERAVLPQFDLIVSNPPYIPLADEPTIEKNVKDFEPSLALFVPDKDPLIFYKAIADFGITHLRPGGKIFVEMNAELAKETALLFEEFGYVTELKEDMQGKTRFVRVQGRV